jgi:nucleoside-diphosphate-sugar epimerase
VSKLAGEKYVLAFAHLYGLDVTVLRYFHVYGPRQESADDRGGVVAIFCRRVLAGLAPAIFGDGTQQRSFTYVKDVVRANLLAACEPAARGQIYNCASGLKITIGELANKVLQLCQRTDLTPTYGDWTPGDIKVFDVDNGKIMKLGLAAWIGFDTGLAETLDWYKSLEK